MDITKDLNYQEGYWAADRVAKNIENTMYETLEAAVNVKKDLYEHFTETLGFSRDMPTFDRNFSYNCGMLDRFVELKKKKDEGTTDNSED